MPLANSRKELQGELAEARKLYTSSESEAQPWCTIHIHLCLLLKTSLTLARKALCMQCAQYPGACSPRYKAT